MVFAPAMVLLLVRMNHDQARERADLRDGMRAFEHEGLQRPVVLLLVVSIRPSIPRACHSRSRSFERSSSPRSPLVIARVGQVP